MYRAPSDDYSVLHVFCTYHDRVCCVCVDITICMIVTSFFCSYRNNNQPTAIHQLGTSATLVCCADSSFGLDVRRDG
jgi:hypothetical protein